MPTIQTTIVANVTASAIVDFETTRMIFTLTIFIDPDILWTT
jgi:hypothetical protein